MVLEMKKITSVLTAGAVSLAMCTGALAATFSDIEGDAYSWAKSYIEDMADLGYIKGYEDGTFQPDKEVSKLECIAMFARAMGVNEEANAAILEKAHEQYDEILKQYSLAWGTDELAYMLYTGALNQSDLNTYIKDVKDEPMKRYEAAIIITKAMNGEETAKNQTAVSLDYTDAKTIPSSALGYVSFVTDAGIMNGMDDGGFSPHTSVLRSQMAVMLARVVDKTGYEYIEAKLTSIDTENSTITLTDSFGSSVEYDYDENTKFKILGSTVKVDYMIENVSVACTVQGGKVISIDTLSGEEDVTVTGKYQGSSTTSGIVTVRVIPTGEKTSKSYVCAKDVSVTYDGAPATLRSFASGDVMTLEISDGKVYAIKGEQQEYTIDNAVISSVNIEDALTITISHSNSEYDGKVLPVSSDAAVRKNGLGTDFSEIYPGDMASITVKYGEVTRVVATSTTQNTEGVIQSVSIATQSTITVRVNGTDRTYVVATDTPITKNDKDITIYDLRVGDTVKITVESEAVTKIACVSSAASGDGRITGTVSALNTSLGFIKVTTDGSDIAETVFCNDTKTKIVDKAGTTKAMKNLTDGTTVTAYGTITNGAFVATLIVIEAQ